MAINKDEVVSELLQKVWGILIAKFPDKTFLPGYTAKGGGYHLEITYWPLLLPVATFEENLGAPMLMLSMAKNSIESCIGMMVASICEDVGGRPFTIDVSTKDVEAYECADGLGRGDVVIPVRVLLKRVRMWPGNSPRPVQTCAGCEKSIMGQGFWKLRITGQRLTKTTLIVASCMLGPFWLTPPLTAGHTASSRGQAHVD